jgi:hypothetical protein
MNQSSCFLCNGERDVIVEIASHAMLRYLESILHKTQFQARLARSLMSLYMTAIIKNFYARQTPKEGRAPKSLQQPSGYLETPLPIQPLRQSMSKE